MKVQNEQRQEDSARTKKGTQLIELTGEAGRLNYAEFRRCGLPLGSGAIESSIRRVINLRLKGNGVFWREHHAEEMLQLRALVISRRWDEQVKRMRAWTKKHHLATWQWTPQLMSCKVEPQTANPQNTL